MKLKTLTIVVGVFFIGCSDKKPIAPAGGTSGNGSGGIVGSGPNGELTADDVKNIPLELETVAGGTGNPSMFGSLGAGHGDRNDTSALNEEQRKLERLTTMLGESEKIRSLMQEYGVNSIYVTNPYMSFRKPTEASVYRNAIYDEHERVIGYEDKVTLSVGLDVTESTVIGALEIYSRSSAAKGIIDSSEGHLY